MAILVIILAVGMLALLAWKKVEEVKTSWLDWKYRWLWRVVRWLIYLIVGLVGWLMMEQGVL